MLAGRPGSARHAARYARHLVQLNSMMIKKSPAKTAYWAHHAYPAAPATKPSRATRFLEVTASGGGAHEQARLDTTPKEARELMHPKLPSHQVLSCTLILARLSKIFPQPETVRGHPFAAKAQWETNSADKDIFGMSYADRAKHTHTSIILPYSVEVRNEFKGRRTEFHPLCSFKATLRKETPVALATSTQLHSAFRGTSVF